MRTPTLGSNVVNCDVKQRNGEAQATTTEQNLGSIPPDRRSGFRSTWIHHKVRCKPVVRVPDVVVRKSGVHIPNRALKGDQ